MKWNPFLLLLVFAESDKEELMASAAVVELFRHTSITFTDKNSNSNCFPSYE
jgi:hypothetical protein